MRQEKASYQRWIGILTLLLLVALMGFVVAGCSGGGEKKDGAATGKAETSGEEHAEGTEESGEHAEESEEESNDPNTLFVYNCGACHGHDGSGVVGPSIRGTSLSTEQIEEKINKGVGEVMPKFKGQLKEEKVKLIVDYVKNELK